jgi:dolichol-phosphate mannosyltransferase
MQIIGTSEQETPSNSLRMIIVTPLANEEQTIEEQLTRTLAQIGVDDRIFCVLDGASRDGTRQKVEAFGQQDPRVVLVWAPESRCVVDAYFAGYRAALNTDCQWILEMDGGLSHSPEEIPQFITAMQMGYDFAAGSRFCPGGVYDGRMTRYALSKGGSILARMMLGSRMHDMCSGFECFSRRALEQVVAVGVKSRAHFFQTEIRHLLQKWKWVEIPIHYTGPSQSVTTATILESLRNLNELRTSLKPLPADYEYEPAMRAAS